MDFLKEHDEQNFARVPLSSMPELLRRLAGLVGRPQTRFAIEFLMVAVLAAAVPVATAVSGTGRAPRSGARLTRAGSHPGTRP